MTRKELQSLASLRLKEAKVLLENGCPEGAYYLAGYAAECAFKACSAKQTERHEFPDLPRAQASWRHNLVELAAAADLDKAIKAFEQQQPELSLNWTIMRQWSEQSRYERRTRPEAEALIRALGDQSHGILTWLRHHW